jgi:anti-sigma B factor antagonist
MAASPSVPNLLQLTTEQGAEQITVRCTGRVTSETANDFQETVRELIPKTKRLVLDLTGIDYIDSSGLGALVNVYMHATRSECLVELSNPKQRIRDLFKLTKLSSVFEGSGMEHFGM